MKKNKNCIYCGKTKFKTLFSSKDRMFDLRGEFFVKKCGCGLVFLDPMPDKSVLRKYYPSTEYYAYENDQNNGFFGNLRKYLIEHYYDKNLLSRLISIIFHDVPAIPSWHKNGKILDVGCGSGDTLVLLKKLGWEIYGLDIDKNALKIAEDRGLQNVINGTYMDIAKFPDNYFNAIRLYHVIEHLDDPVCALKIIYKKLKQNGELIIGTPNAKSFAAWLFGKYWLNLDVPRHLVLFNPSMLRNLLMREGYEIEHVDFCSGGGVVGSIGYWLSDLTKSKINILSNTFIVILFYPIEWLFDKLKYGDVFVIRAKK